MKNRRSKSNETSRTAVILPESEEVRVTVHYISIYQDLKTRMYNEILSSFNCNCIPANKVARIIGELAYSDVDFKGKFIL